jgi:hypothetical protein
MFSRNFIFVSVGLALVSLGRLFAAHAPEVWTTVNDNDPGTAYSPGMEMRDFSGYFRGDMHVSRKPGEWASFSFTGTGVKWIGAKNVDHGEAEVYIDGKLDTTVKAIAPTWLMQQEVYTKTGLSPGPHVLKIVVKTAAYQDFDAFAFLGPAPRVATMPEIAGVKLPSLQPLLNEAHRYPIGNGMAVAVCGPDGQIETVFGPGYTTTDLVAHEDLFIGLDGEEQPLHVQMRRAAGTGVFYGVASRGDLDIGVVDFACAGQPWVSRLIAIKNTSAAASHTVVVRDAIAPFTTSGNTHGTAIDAAKNAAGIFAQGDTSIGVPYGGSNPVDKAVVISFSDPASTATSDASTAAVKTAPITLAPHAQQEVTLTHYFRAGHDLADSACLDAIRHLDSRAGLQKSIADWQTWFDGVPAAYRLSRIKEDRARVLMEGALMVLKTNVSQDGGMIAHTTHYKEGYVRDAAMGIRGLLAAGHSDEAKKWLVWIDKKLSLQGHLGDAMNCSVSLDDKNASFDMGDMSVEEPGWVLLVARDYYRQTHDLDFLKSIDKTLSLCMDVQLKEAAANGDKLAFNGDETEICGAADLHNTGAPDNIQQHTWSLSSIAMAAAALDFYAEYVKLRGDDPANYHNAQDNSTVDLGKRLKDLVAAMDRDFWRTDVPAAPGGFHDFFRGKSDNSWPKGRLANFTLMPVFFSTPYPADEKAKDVAVIAPMFDSTKKVLPLVAGSNMEGHDLGYLLWGMVETGDWRKELVYRALVDGPTVDCWGSFCEAYDQDGHANDHDLRSLETGINVSALAKYWGLGK